MSDPPRHEYVLRLGTRHEARPPDDGTRHATPDDHEPLAQLMLDAYDGTIDYDGETIVEARDEVRRYLDGAPLLDCSWVRIEDGEPVSAVLVGWSTRDCPIVSYVMTTPAWKGQGLAADLLARALASLSGLGHQDVVAWVTEGNTPSERLLARAGFGRR
jgi:RimJ/RimL family protein N-acetyltransferase